MKLVKKTVTALAAALLLACCLLPAAAEQAEEKAARVLPDGVYTVDFLTDSSMFRANEACDRKGTLTVVDGVQTMHVSLAGKKIVNLYPGKAEAAKLEGAVLLQPTVDKVTYSDGFTEEVFGFDVPVTSVGEDFDLALIGTKGVWYDHVVSAAHPVPEEGTYTCEVALSGGSGRAKVTSPAVIVSDGKTLTATIEWSSPNYEYMLVDEQRYEPVQTEGNSTFEIPVILDEELGVSASTIAMGTPHLIEYTLYFDSTSLCKQ